MKGFVPTPEAAVDLMVEKLFRRRPPAPGDRVLDPGSGRGAFVDGVNRYCTRRGLQLPTVVAIESDPAHVSYLRSRYAGTNCVRVRNADFLTMPVESFDFVIGNPPYVSISGLNEDEKALYRRTYATASGRFDLYILFFEKALQCLRDGGRLVFITPEKFLYVNTAVPLRHLLASASVSELHYFPEDTFPDRVTYPLVTVVDAVPTNGECVVTDRSGATRTISGRLPTSSWLPVVRSAAVASDAPTLADVTTRISCGVATGSDSVFVFRNEDVPGALRPYTHPTLSGRDIVSSELPALHSVMLLPYDQNGTLIPEPELGVLGDYLRDPARYERLIRRTCTRVKPWYAFHETPPLKDLLRPKLLCKDIGAEPQFVVDRIGNIVPRHSLYYIVPRDVSMLDELAEFLNSPHVARWLRDHCQRAAKGFLRVQSHVLKRLPLPPSLCPEPVQLPLAMSGVAERRTA